MTSWFVTDWHKVFAPQLSLPEILVRGITVYLMLCLMLRVVLKRQAGRVALGDLLVVTLVAGVCRNPLVADSYSITDGLLVVATVLMTGYAVDWACYYFPFFHGLMHASPRCLIKNNQVEQDNLRRELMTEGQLLCKLRLHGISGVDEVKEAYLEGDGSVSVIKNDADAGPLPLVLKAGLPDALRSGGLKYEAALNQKLLETLKWHNQQATALKNLLGDCDSLCKSSGNEKDRGGEHG